jgi:hypothetical protein
LSHFWTRFLCLFMFSDLLTVIETVWEEHWQSDSTRGTGSARIFNENKQRARYVLSPVVLSRWRYDSPYLLKDIQIRESYLGRDAKAKETPALLEHIRC